MQKIKIPALKLFNNTTLIFTLILSMACNQSSGNEESGAVNEEPLLSNGNLKKAYFASGCFWCVEAIFEEVKGVTEVISGYSGGKLENPTYEQVSSSNTRHAEAVEIYYDPEIVSYETLLKVFFGSHDPTTPNQQGPDYGPQYRSMILYTSDEEKKLAEDMKARLNESGDFDGEIVTEIVPFQKFYKAEDYHQNYEKNHPENPYVQNVSIPRLKRFEAKFPELLK